MCPVCQRSMVGKRPHAVYCSRRCKTKASDNRRRADGRSRARDHRRYVSSEGEHRRAYAIAYYVANAENCRVRSRRWRKANPDRKLISEQRRRARKLASWPSVVTREDWNRLVIRFDRQCAYCGQRATPLVMEHVVPLSRGGRHAIGNILPACRPCNSSKGAAFLVEWRRRLSRARGGESHPHPYAEAIISRTVSGRHGSRQQPNSGMGGFEVDVSVPHAT